MSKMVSVDPTGWLLDRALNDYYAIEAGEVWDLLG